MAEGLNHRRGGAIGSEGLNEKPSRTAEMSAPTSSQSSLYKMKLPSELSDLELALKS